MGGKSGGSTVGYRYFMGLHMAICQGPVTSLNQIYVGERSLGISQQSSNTTIVINKTELFGGDKKEGGIYGNLDVEFGEGTQLVNPYLFEQFGSDTPAFRGTTCVVFRVNRLGGFFFKNYSSSSDGGYVSAMSPYPKPWAFDVTDIPGGSFNQTKQIVDDVANGGHIIFDCLTDVDWGVGVPASDLDSTSFTLVTDTIFDEDFGLSMIYAQQSSMEDFIQEVLTHINAVLYTDRTSNNFTLKLIRDDFDVGTLQLFDETNIASFIKFERPAFAELVNEITLVYRKRGDFEDSSITVQDLASIQAQGAVVSQTVQFPGIDNDDLAARVASRELKQASTPLARVKLLLNREAWNVNPGDVIKVSWGAYGIEQVVIRVANVDYGTFESGLVRIDGLEDIFGLPDNSYLAPVDSGWADEVGDPVAAPSTLVKELPFFVIETTFGIEEINLLVDDSAILQSIAETPAVATFNFKLNTRIGANDYAQVSDGEFAPTAQLVAALDQTTKTTIAIKNFKGSVGQVVIGGYAYLNGEILRVDSVDLLTGLMDVGRGFLDSYPRSHIIDDIIYFADSNNAIDIVNIYEPADEVDAKVLTQTGSGTLDLADAVEDTIIMVGRRTKPYPAAQVQLGGSFFPAAVTSVPVNVTWTHQDRTQQLTIGGQDWYEISLGSPEAGVLYTVRYYNNDTLTLLNTDAGISGLSSSFIPVGATGLTFNMRVEVDAIRDGTITNLDTFTHIFLYTKPIEFRTLEDADSRTLENGDVRILES
ncbi:MAG: phage tail protein [Desulfocapsa sp.]|nr:phage tail protein [Desulfocapsa sp.]